MANTVRAAVNPSQAFLERCSPFKDLPDDSDTVNALREVNYIKTKLRYFLVPTSLPGDDYALCSTLLRSLETRRDLTWLVLQETGTQDTIRAISRRGGPRNPIPDEHFDLTQRAKALTAHWKTLSKQPDQPREWEPGFATQRAPPLITEDFKLDLDPTQIAEAEEKYEQWRTHRDLKVSYLKRNPPPPTGYVQATRDEVPVDETWDILPWVILPGTASPNDGTRRWLPIYTSLVTQHVPVRWRNPDVPPPREKTKEEWDQWKEEYEKGMERNEKQHEFQKQLREAKSE
ncbi:hypothetical protein ACHAPT_008807 [Fusarium lateritium]